MKDSQLQILLDKYLTEDLGEGERLELQKMLQSENQRPAIEQYMDEYIKNIQSEQLLENPGMLKVVQEKLSHIINEDKFVRPAHRIHFLKRRWFRYAAAIILIVGGAITAIVLSSDKQSQQQIVTYDNNNLQSDIPPGGEKAVLTLADGTQILLDSAANGAVAQQGNAAIVKLANGQIAYNLKNGAAGDMMMNTMSTPKGGRYQLTLPDGTRVWLNAGSSITYPAVFPGNQRKVKIKGEAYFEVAKNTKQPFIVDINGKSAIDVLGTSFNINAYENEADIKTTLITGSVKINQQVVLKPGEQAVQAGTNGSHKIAVIQADIEKALAWKNGWFDFNGAGLYEVMRQLERWYDIKVEYAGKVPDVEFKGKMSSGVKLSTIRSWFSELGITTKLEGKTLVVF